MILSNRKLIWNERSMQRKNTKRKTRSSTMTKKVKMNVKVMMRQRMYIDDNNNNDNKCENDNKCKRVKKATRLKSWNDNCDDDTIDARCVLKEQKKIDTSWWSVSKKEIERRKRCIDERERWFDTRSIRVVFDVNCRKDYVNDTSNERARDFDNWKRDKNVNIYSRYAISMLILWNRIVRDSNL